LDGEGAGLAQSGESDRVHRRRTSSPFSLESSPEVSPSPGAREICLDAVLASVEVVVAAPVYKGFVVPRSMMRTRFHDQELIGAANRREAMRDDESSAARIK